jgi:hypothetical protein
MENKQTAVEWLVEQIDGLDTGISYHHFKEKVEQAKEMEKEQIINAHLIGLITSMEMEATKQAEQYYNETFKSE